MISHCKGSVRSSYAKDPSCRPSIWCAVKLLFKQIHGWTSQVDPADLQINSCPLRRTHMAGDCLFACCWQSKLELSSVVLYLLSNLEGGEWEALVAVKWVSGKAETPWQICIGPTAFVLIMLRINARSCLLLLLRWCSSSNQSNIQRHLSLDRWLQSMKTIGSVHLPLSSSVLFRSVHCRLYLLHA